MFKETEFDSQQFFFLFKTNIGLGSSSSDNTAYLFTSVFTYATKMSKQDIFTRLSWRRTALHDWLDAEDILTAGYVLTTSWRQNCQL